MAASINGLRGGLPARAVATTDARADDDARADVRVAGSPNV